MTTEAISFAVGFDVTAFPYDLTIVVPEEEGGAVKIEAIRTALESIELSPVAAPRKVIVIEHAHTITIPAQQSLLKVLEEPPSHVQFILATSKPAALLPTIQSRVTHIQHGHETHKAQELLPIDEMKTWSITMCIKQAEVFAKDTPAFEAMLEATIEALTQELHEAPASKRELLVKVIEEAIACHTRLQKNVQAKLAIEHFMFRVSEMQ